LYVTFPALGWISKSRSNPTASGSASTGKPPSMIVQTVWLLSLGRTQLSRAWDEPRIVSDPRMSRSPVESRSSANVGISSS
jgi:hypothetical protein